MPDPKHEFYEQAKKRVAAMMEQAAGGKTAEALEELEKFEESFLSDVDPGDEDALKLRPDDDPA